jgi:hypothetical protein
MKINQDYVVINSLGQFLQSTTDGFKWTFEKWNATRYGFETAIKLAEENCVVSYGGGQDDKCKVQKA